MLLKIITEDWVLSKKAKRKKERDEFYYGFSDCDEDWPLSSPEASAAAEAACFERHEKLKSAERAMRTRQEEVRSELRGKREAAANLNKD